ncbi:cyclohexanecarboxylate-CoA ligase/acyl-CoA synthetase [Williamsia limnetica]|uniref:Cyclohexanecarboxylate-CoA ligase/acyl-CoA synthetase n=1 Tax=Williamsia limnetica TaxID=882452 RepID=A0A318RCX6_WILLI|nr:AMP-binding protein [Williamsia limnetica]PYE11687.1 cyclohexanecarboxylate-CoA ligase/acyl-CoA synthetase [Williamsia limnetica]
MTTHIDDREIRPEDRYESAVTAQFRSDGYWRDESLAQWVDHWASVQPEVEVFSDGDVAYTWAELRNKGYRLAAALRKRGIGRGDRVQVQLPNWSEFAVIYVALARIGAVLVPTMPIYRHDEVAYVINHSGARMSFVGNMFRGFNYADMLEEIRPQCVGLEEVVVVRAEDGASVTRFEELVGEGDTPLDEELGPIPSADDTHAIIYTSGTESRPKGCQHTFNTMTYSLYNLCRDILHLGPGEVMFQPSPVTHATGLMAGVTGPIVLGASAHIMPAWDPVDGMRRIEKYRCTASMTATPFVRMALDALDGGEFDVSSLKVWDCAGAPIPEVLLREWQAKMPTTALLPLYGCSEGFIVTACTPDSDPAKAVTSDGNAPAGVWLELRDPDGAVVPQGEEGEIWHGGPGLMLSYWQNPERTANEIDADGFKRSGDLGRMDPDGYLRVTGRIKDLIIRGGTNISAREIEEHLLTHPDIVNAAVVGYPDERLGERACAFVVPAEGATPTLEAVADYLKNDRKIAIQKLPERLTIVESLPTTATGKVQKFLLRNTLTAQ